MTRVRVARVITRLNVGGPSIQALLLTERLDPTKYETLLIAGEPGSREGEMTDLYPVEVRPMRIPSLRRAISPLHDLRALVHVTRALSGFRPHVVHTHLTKAGLVGRIAARLVGVPVIVHTFHGNVLRGYFRTPASRSIALMERALARISSRVIVISPQQRAEILHAGIATPARIVEVPLGLDLSRFVGVRPGVLRAELRVAPEAPLVGIVARLVPIKAVHRFLDMAVRVRSQCGDAVFVIVGDGHLRTELEGRSAELGLAAHVHFLGWRSDLPAIYADLDVVVLTSINEGTPVSLIEALASGRTVAAMDVGGVADVVGSAGGVLSPAGDADALASAVVGLIRDPAKRAEIAQRARGAVYPKHDAEALVARIQALYAELLNEKR